jgi:hypothetical protein
MQILFNWKIVCEILIVGLACGPPTAQFHLKYILLGTWEQQ